MLFKLLLFISWTVLLLVFMVLLRL